MISASRIALPFGYLHRAQMEPGQQARITWQITGDPDVDVLLDAGSFSELLVFNPLPTWGTRGVARVRDALIRIAFNPGSVPETRRVLLDRVSHGDKTTIWAPGDHRQKVASLATGRSWTRKGTEGPDERAMEKDAGERRRWRRERWRGRVIIERRGRHGRDRGRWWRKLVGRSGFGSGRSNV
jgi:hypothetical protein